MVLTQKKVYINEKKGSEKLLASNMELGPTFEKKTFGTCSVTNSACVPNITKWDGATDRVELPNGGSPLLEDSLGTCAVGGAPCVEILFHGQTAEVTSDNEKDTDDEIIPLINALAADSGKKNFFISLHD